MIKDDIEFFKYYLPALKEALLSNGNNRKDASWFYPKDISQEMDKYEDSIYSKYPIIDMAYVYFDAKSHGYESINIATGNISINSYLQKTITCMVATAKLLKIDFSFEN